MRRWTLIIFWFLVPMVACANPVILNPSSLLAFGVVAFMALVVEAGIVALLLTFAGLSPLRLFAGFFFTNLAVFLLIFCPLLDHQSIPWLVLELLVVGIDAAAIKLRCRFGTFQGDGYRGVSWLLAGLTALAGNAVSFFVGVIGNGAPWAIHTVNNVAE